MKLIIQIPCYNEQDTIAAVLADLPRRIPGVDTVEYLVIDDGSTDRTVETARQNGAHHILSLGTNRGLAAAFSLGIKKALELGADIIVNTDGDNQYDGTCIPELIAPIVDQRLDVVVGQRPIENITHFSWLKKKLQSLGSCVVRQFSGTDIPDTTSGFRAYSAPAAMKLHVFNNYTYTLETIIQAGHNNMRIGAVPIRVNDKTRESRLISSIPRYIRRSALIILRSYVIYRPMQTFCFIALLPFLPGLGICLYWLIVWQRGHIQSLLLGVALLLLAFNIFSLGILAGIIGANRKLIHEVLFHCRLQTYNEMKKPGPDR